MDKRFCVYLVTNTVNGKVYVGKTGQGLEKRWTDHVYTSHTEKKNYLHKAISKYGEDSFDVSLLETNKTAEEASSLEKSYIVFFQSYRREFGYNLTMGGEGNEGNEETRKKISEALRKIPTEKLHNLYLIQGLSVEKVAKELGCYPSGVWRMLKYDGIQTRPHRAKIDENRLRHLYTTEKLSTVKLAEELGISQSAIIRRLTEMGISIRDAQASKKESWTQRFDPRGMKIGTFKVTGDNYVVARRKRYWLCCCETCGYEHYYDTTQLKKGMVSSCEFHQKNQAPLLSSDEQMRA